MNIQIHPQFCPICGLRNWIGHTCPKREERERTMISVRCFTNLDDFQQEIWPTKMVCRPMIGDMVRSERGIRLRVASIVHTTHANGNPLLKVELHSPLRFWTPNPKTKIRNIRDCPEDCRDCPHFMVNEDGPNCSLNTKDPDHGTF